jgi:hypothetical protein
MTQSVATALRPLPRRVPALGGHPQRRRWLAALQVELSCCRAGVPSRAFSHMHDVFVRSIDLSLCLFMHHCIIAFLNLRATIPRGIAAAAGLLGPVSHDLLAGVPGDGLLPLQGSASSTVTPAAGGSSAASQQQQVPLHWRVVHRPHTISVH